MAERPVTDLENYRLWHPVRKRTQKYERRRGPISNLWAGLVCRTALAANNLYNLDDYRPKPAIEKTEEK